MGYISALEAAKYGTLEDFKEFYVPGTANQPTGGDDSLLMDALRNKNPENRAAISSYLIDDGADVTWLDPRGKYSLLHLLLARFFPKEPIAVSDCELLARLMDEGADINQVAKKGGTLIQSLVEMGMNLLSEKHLVPVYEVVFARDDLDLLKTGSFGQSSYRTVWLARDGSPVLWEYVQRWVDDHGVVVPDREVAVALSVGDAAARGTLQDFKEFYVPGTANRRRRGISLLATAVRSNYDPANRAAIANHLLDDGADASWTEPFLKNSLLHALLGNLTSKNEPVAASDCQLMSRLMDDGADVNAVANQGTLVQALVVEAVGSKPEERLVPLYDVVFARDDLDLLRTGAFKQSSYRSVWLRRDQVPLLWEHVQQWVDDHGVVVPEEERAPR